MRCAARATAGGPRPATHAPAARRRLATACVLASGLALGGCAGVMRVDSEVTHHAKWPANALPTGAVSYVFERLPSQADGQGALRQNELEALASQVLATKGWQLAAPPTSAQPTSASPTTAAQTSAPGQGAPVPATPAAWRVQVVASQTTLPRAPWDDPPHGAWPRWNLNASNAGLGLGLSWGMLRGDMPYHQRSVSVVVRDGVQGHVAYEAQAAHDGRWNSTPAVWQAMLEAALTGFPQPTGTRQQVNIDVPR